MENFAIMEKKPPSWRLVKNAFNNSISLVVCDVRVGIKYSVTQQQTQCFAFTSSSSNRLDRKINLNENGIFSFSYHFEAD